MPQEVVQVQFQPIGKRVAISAGTDLLAAAIEAGIDLASACGGEGNCGQCRVAVLVGDVSPLSLDEEFILSDIEQFNGERLACCTEANSDVTVHIPRKSLISGQRLQIESNLSQITVDPLLQAVPFNLTPPTMDDLRSDLTRLRDYLVQTEGVVDVFAETAVIQQLSPTLRAQNWEGTVYVCDGQILGLAHVDSPALGFAVDLGTTKIACSLVDLASGAEIAACGAPNPQIGYGEDVISRINYVSRNTDGAQVLANKVRETLNSMLGDLLQQAGVAKEQVVDACIVGNTAMIHLLLGLPVAQLARAPYVAAVNSAMNVRAAEIGLEMAPGACAFIPPCIGGFVGADHVAMLLACEFDQIDKVTLGIDIGTNSEIVIRKPGMPLLNSASCASGPAFEGAHIGDGMRAADGAIEKVRITEDGPVLRTIADKPAVGLCGSGIVDIVAELYAAGLINYRGRFEKGAVGNGRFGPQFLLVPAQESGTGHEIVITQQDINQIQLAKGAINAGLSILLDLNDIAAEEVQEVVIAGAFGSFINVKNAIAMGLLPELPNAGYRQVGNAAFLGAKWMLVSQEARHRAQQITNQTRYRELTTFPKFSRRFALGMLFPGHALGK